MGGAPACQGNGPWCYPAAMKSLAAGVLSAVLCLVATAEAQEATTSTPAAAEPELSAEEARARDAEARGLFQAGRASFDAGRYQSALDYFERAYELSPRAQLLYNIGQAADRMRLDTRTLAAFEKYLEELPEAPNRTEVENRVRALRALKKDKSPPAPEPIVAPEAVTGPSPAGDDPTALDAKLGAGSQQPRDDGSILEEWWFWTAVGVVVAGGITVALVAGSGGDTREGELTKGTDGVVITTLSLE